MRVGEERGQKIAQKKENKKWIFYVFLLILMFVLSPAGMSTERFAAERFATERLDRAVDRVALDAQEHAISRLSRSLERYRNREAEPNFIFKLAQAYQQSAAIQFRIAYGLKAPIQPSPHSEQHSLRQTSRLSLVGTKGGSGEFQRYQKALQLCISQLNFLIDRFPHFPDRDLAYFMRAKAYEDLNQPMSARQDYLKLVEQYPQSERTIPSYMALAEIDMNNQDYLNAVKSLLHVQQAPQSPFYPFALYKLAWSYYNLQQMNLALKFITLHIRYFDALVDYSRLEFQGATGLNSTHTNTIPKEKNVQDNALLSSDAAMREKSLADLVLFYGEGFERHPEQYPIAKALEYFKSVEKGSLLGQMTLHLTRYLRSHQHEIELLAWRDLLLREEPQRPETLETLMCIVEYQMNQKQYAKAIETVKSLRTYHDPRVPRVYLNLAEALFQVGEFESATEHYRWIMTNWDQKSGLDQGEIALKAIGSRYEALRKDRAIPERLAARKLDSSQHRDLKAPLQEWINWIDNFSQIKHVNQTLEGFEFDANRAIYQAGSNQESLERLLQFIRNHPNSTFSVPSASLVLDTYIASEEWGKILTFWEEFMSYHWNQSGNYVENMGDHVGNQVRTQVGNQVRNPGSGHLGDQGVQGLQGDFKARLFQVSADAAFKKMEEVSAHKELTLVITLGDDYLKKFEKSPRSLDFRMLMAQARAQMGNPELAQEQLSQIILASKDFKQRQTALFFRAQLKEQNYEFDGAIRDYQTLLKEPGEPPKGLLKRLSFLLWLSQDGGQWCQNETPDCKKYWALTRLKTKHLNALSSEELQKNALDSYVHRALKGENLERAIWGLLALKQEDLIELRKRLWIVREVSKNWGKLDPLLKFSLVPALSALIPKAIKDSRMELNRVIPINRPSAESMPKLIVRRVEWIREIEKTVEPILELPLLNIKSQTLSELAETYHDFTKVLQKHASFDGLGVEERKDYEKSIREILKPFEEKNKKLASKAKEVASEGQSTQNAIAIDIPFLSQVDPSIPWDHPQGNEKHPPASLENLKKQWARAYQDHSPEKALFFLLELESKDTHSESLLKILRGLTLKSLGAQAEGLSEINLALKSLKKSLKISANTEGNEGSLDSRGRYE